MQEEIARNTGNGAVFPSVAMGGYLAVEQWVGRREISAGTPPGGNCDVPSRFFIQGEDGGLGITFGRRCKRRMYARESSLWRTDASHIVECRASKKPGNAVNLFL